MNLKLSYSIHSKDGQFNKTDYFDEDDSLSVLFSKAKDFLKEEFNEDESIFSINGEIIDENMLISQYCTNKNPSGTIKLNIEKKIPISILLNNQFLDIDVYENIKMADSPYFYNSFAGNFESFNFLRNGNPINIYQTPKELDLKPNTAIIAISADSNIEPNETRSFLPGILNSQTFDSDSQSFEKKTELPPQNETQININSPIQNNEIDQNSNNINSFTNNTINSSTTTSKESSSSSSSLTSFSVLVKSSVPQVLSVQKPVNNDLNWREIFTSTKPSLDDPIEKAESKSILVPEPQIYSAIITVTDASGDGVDINVRDSKDATEMAENLLSITALDVIEAYCKICGIENEGLILFSPKYDKIESDSLIWKLFLKKKRIKKSEKKEQKEQREDQIEKKVVEDDHKKLISYLKSHPSLTAEFSIRQNKELMNHFDVLVSQIPFSMQEDQLLEYFKRFGNVTQISIFRNKNKQSKGIARVTFEREIDANKAVENGKTLRYTQEKNQPFLHVFRPQLQYATTSQKKLKAVFYDRI